MYIFNSSFLNNYLAKLYRAYTFVYIFNSRFFWQNSLRFLPESLQPLDACALF